MDGWMDVKLKFKVEIYIVYGCMYGCIIKV